MNLPNLVNILNLPAYSSWTYLIPIGILSFIVIFGIFLLLNTYFMKILGKATDLETKKEKEYDEAADVLEGAQRQAMSIVTDANKGAKKILEDASMMGKEMTEDLDEHLEHFTRDQTEVLTETAEILMKVQRKALMEASKENLQALKEISEQFKSEVASEIEAFRTTLDQVAADAQEDMKREMDQYKEARKKQIDEAVYNIIREASTNIIGRSLNVEDHEEYILGILEEAKGRGELSAS